MKIEGRTGNWEIYILKSILNIDWSFSLYQQGFHSGLNKITYILQNYFDNISAFSSAFSILSAF